MLVQRIHRRIVAIVVLGAIALFSCWYVWQNAEEFLTYQWTIEPRWLGLAFVVYSLDLWIAILAWHVVCQTVFPKHEFWPGARIYAASLLFRRLPFGSFIGGGSRLYLYEQLGIGWRQTAVAVAVEWVATLIAGGLVGLCFWSFHSDIPLLTQVGLIGLLLSLVVLAQPYALSLATRRVGGMGQNSAAEPPDAPPHISRWRFALIIALYVLVWVVGGVIVFCVTRALTDAPIGALPAVVGMWAVAGTAGMIAVILPSGLGIVEVSLSLLLATQVAPTIAAATAILVRLLVTVGESIWTLIAWRAQLLSRATILNGRRP